MKLSQAFSLATLLTFLVGGAMKSQGLGGHDPSQLMASASLRAEHARKLFALAESALAQRLFNESERLILIAKQWDLAPTGFKALQTRLREERGRCMRGPARDEARAFWGSKAYPKALKKLKKREEVIKSRAVRVLAALALELVKQRKEAEAEATIRLAVELERSPAKLDLLVGATRVKRLRAERSNSFHIDRLELGDSVIGPPLQRDRLLGKVVLWRSYNL